MPWEKGQSGNVSGRPKLNPELKQKLKQLGEESLSVIESLMRSAEDASIRLKAAQYLSDRAFGKPHQAVDMEMTGDISLTVRLIRK